MNRKRISFDHPAFEKKVKELLEHLSIPYVRIDDYVSAFVHKSILNENSSHFNESNERLEFF